LRSNLFLLISVKYLPQIFQTPLAINNSLLLIWRQKRI